MMQTIAEDAQLDREVAEALRVQSMCPDERYEWLRESWGYLQRQADFLYADLPDRKPAVHSFATLEEKNRFDEAREIDFALAVTRMSTS